MHANGHKANSYAETQMQSLRSPMSNSKKSFRQLNVASQKGLIENFDSHVGRTTVLMPLGGKHSKNASPCECEYDTGTQ